MGRFKAKVHQKEGGEEMKIVSHVKEVLEEVAKKRMLALEALGIQGEANAKREITTLVYDTPESPNYIRTGRLRNSLTHAVEGKKAIIGSYVSYAPYVEYGTSKYPVPRPYLRNAVENYQDEYKQIIEDILKG